LHDKSSQLWDKLILALSYGKLCVIDVSQMRGKQSLSLSGLILRRIFDRNQQEFTAAEPKTIPTIAVVEEAQSVLNENAAGAEPYIAWVKEGRKYDLGALLITQQPGSIPVDILSQGDNWFIFHLLSSSDLTTLRRANAHFSDDLLSSLLNEPIPGQGVFWSSVGGQPYPIAIRALSFEDLYQLQDPNYNRDAVSTFALQIKQHFESVNAEFIAFADLYKDNHVIQESDEQTQNETDVDYMQLYKDKAIETFHAQYKDNQEIRTNGFPWGKIVGILQGYLPTHLDEINKIAYDLVLSALEMTFGERGIAWESEKKSSKTGKSTVWVRVLAEFNDDENR